MALLIVGIVFWSVTHLFPAAAPGVRTNLVGKFGLAPYKGLFALDIVLALALIVYGWKTATPASLYAPPLYGSPIPAALLMIAILLLVASSLPNNLKRYIRHPQMTAVVFWGAGHLLTNGDSRSTVLFGGLVIWAVLEVIFINRRDGQWRKPEAVSVMKDAVTVLIAVAAYALLINFHAFLFGVSAIIL